ncbi:hypothetical protein GCM10023068_38600 [Leifsonia shinshuensis]
MTLTAVSEVSEVEVTGVLPRWDALRGCAIEDDPIARGPDALARGCTAVDCSGTVGVVSGVAADRTYAIPSSADSGR